jgi:hypothetical protein
VKLRPGQIILLVAGLGLVIFGFLHFYDIDTGGQDISQAQCEQYSGLDSDQCEAYVDGGFSAWNSSFFFPLSAWPAILGGLVAVMVALQAFTATKLPTILGFTPKQLALSFGVASTLIMFGWLVQGEETGFTRGTGFWLSAVACGALLVGAVMEIKADDAPAATTAPTPF